MRRTSLWFFVKVIYNGILYNNEYKSEFYYYLQATIKQIHAN